VQHAILHHTIHVVHATWIYQGSYKSITAVSVTQMDTFIRILVNPVLNASHYVLNAAHIYHFSALFVKTRTPYNQNTYRASTSIHANARMGTSTMNKISRAYNVTQHVAHVLPHLHLAV